MADIKIVVETTKHYTCKVSRAELLRVMNSSGGLPQHLPADTQVTITVPSGGDYSGDDLDLDEAGGLTLSWVEREVSQPERKDGEPAATAATVRRRHR